MSLAEFKKKIRRQETPFHKSLFKIAKSIRNVEVPYIKGWHDLLYHEKSWRIYAWRSFWRVMYNQPLFRSRCRECGKGLHVYHSGQGLPWIEGDIEINVGRNVRLYDRITISGLTVGEHPRLIIGDNTDISQPVTILVGNEVVIGSNCLIGCTMITDNPGHRKHYLDRFEKLEPERIRRVEIGDYVWASTQSIITGNVTVGFGAVIGARAIVTQDIPPFCVVAGNPARIVNKLPFPEELIEKLGRESYLKYENAVIER